MISFWTLLHSGRWHSIVPTITPEPACRCCRSSPARARPNARCFSIPWCCGPRAWRLGRWASRAGSTPPPALVLSALFTGTAMRVWRDESERSARLMFRFFAALFAADLQRAAGRPRLARRRRREPGDDGHGRRGADARTADPGAQPGALRGARGVGGVTLRYYPRADRRLGRAGLGRPGRSDAPIAAAPALRHHRADPGRGRRRDDRADFCVGAALSDSSAAPPGSAARRSERRQHPKRSRAHP